MKRCKHYYVIHFAKGYEQQEIVKTNNGKYATLKLRCGCSVYCAKCGKQKKHLSRKIGRLYANTINNNFVKSYENAMKDAEIQICRHKINLGDENGLQKNICNQKRKKKTNTKIATKHSR